MTLSEHTNLCLVPTWLGETEERQLYGLRESLISYHPSSASNQSDIYQFLQSCDTMTSGLPVTLWLRPVEYGAGGDGMELITSKRKAVRSTDCTAALPVFLADERLK